MMRILLLLPLLAVPAQAIDCETLASAAKLPATTITAATAFPGGSFRPPHANPIDMPAFCRVAGVIRPTSDSSIRFEVWMPASSWNHNYLGAGNGGFAGSIGFDQMANNLKRGFATSGTDTGHQGGAIDASWAFHHPEKVTDFGWRAIHLTTENAKRLIEMYYSEAPKRSYFDACSDGGREALMEAQRFPADFDGILAGAPAYDWTKLISSGAAKFQILGDPAAYIPLMKLPAIAKATLAACDAQDGVQDGIISDPSRCHFEPSVLLCKAEDSLDCLTAPQVSFLKSIYDGVKSSRSGVVFPGFLPGGETGPGGWADWILGGAPGTGNGAAYFASYFRYMVYDNPTWSPFSADFDSALHAAEERTAQALNAVDPDLSKFESRGGKLILYHGWNDPAIPAQSTINYFRSVQQKMGSDEAAQFVRLYMVPGMQHCIGGPGPDYIGQFGTPTADAGVFGALERWVEKGTAPGEVVATKLDPATHKVQMTRPLCPYPQVARYKGAGDPNDYRNFTCSAAE